MEKRLDQLSSRFLNLLVAMFSGGKDATVVVSERSKRPLMVAFASRTVVLNPRQAGLFDVVLGAALFRRRAAAKLAHKQEPAETFRFDVAQPWIQETYENLVRDYPQITSLAGHFQLRQGSTWPQLSWTAIEFDPLTTGVPRVDRFSLSIDSTPGVEYTGCDHDFDWFIEALRSGQVAAHSFAELREMPVVFLPLKINACQARARDSNISNKK